MQLNIRALNAKRKVSPTHDQLSSSDYYVTMTISRDQNASSDDVAFTCTSSQKKVFITKSTVSLIPSSKAKYLFFHLIYHFQQLLNLFQVGLFRPKIGGDMMPERFSVNHIDKNSNEDFINCEFSLAESLKMQKEGWLLYFLNYRVSYQNTGFVEKK